MKKKSLSLFIFFLIICLSVSSQNLISITDFSKGLITKYSPLLLPAGSSPDLSNVDWEEGILTSRKGSILYSDFRKDSPTILSISSQSEFSAGETLTNVDTTTSAGTTSITKDVYTSDLCEGGTASASSSQGDFPPSKAFDNDTSNSERWDASSLSPGWIKYDFGESNGKKIEKLRAYFWYDTDYEMEGSFQASNDDTNWDTLVEIGMHYLTGTWEEFAFENNIAYRYYRIYYTYFGYGGVTESTPCLIEAEMIAKPYQSSAQYVSTKLDRGIGDKLTYFLFTVDDNKNGETIAYYQRHSLTLAEIDNENWTLISSSDTITSDDRYCQLKADLSTSDTTITPYIYSLTITSHEDVIIEKPITSLGEFKTISGQQYFLCAIDTTVYKSLGDGSWTKIHDGLTSGQNVEFLTYLDTCWITNGKDIVWSLANNGTTINTYPDVHKGKYSCIFQDRLIMANDVDNPSYIYYSPTAQPDSTASHIDIQAGDGDEVTSVFVWSGDLYIGKRHSLWVLSGSTSANWVLRCINSSVGILEHRGVQVTDAGVVFPSVWGIYSLGYLFAEQSGARLTLLTDNIEPDYLDARQVQRSKGWWLTTTQAEWAEGETQTNIDTTTTVGSIQIDDTSDTIWIQTTDADFNAGTKTNITVANNSFSCSKTAIALDQYDDTTSTAGYTRNKYQSFIPDTDCLVPYIVLYIRDNVSGAGDPTLAPVSCDVDIYSDSSNSPGSLLYSSQSVDWSGAGGNQWNTFTFATDAPISGGTRYWIHFAGGDGTSPSGGVVRRIDVYYSNNAYSEGNIYEDATHDFLFKQYENKYSNTGNLISQSIYYGTDYYTFDSFTYDVNLNGQTIVWKSQTSADNSNWSSEATITDGVITSTPNFYFRWIAYLSGTNNQSPVVNSVSTDFSPKGARYISAIHSTGTDSPYYGIFETYYDDKGETLQFYVRTDTDGLNMEANTWHTATNGYEVSGLNNYKYCQFKIYMATDDVNISPIVNSVKINWYSTPTSTQPLASVWWKNRYWFGYSGEGQFYNNSIGKLYRSGAWTKYNDLYPYCFQIFQNKLYCGDSKYAKIWQLDIGNNDDGNGISWHWYSKQFDGDNPFLAKRLKRLYITAKADQNDTITVDISYNLDENINSTQYALYPKHFREQDFNRFISWGDIYWGRFIQIKLENETLIPFELINMVGSLVWESAR